MCGKVVWIHLRRASQHTFGVLQVSFCQINLAQHDVGTTEVRVEPNRFLQWAYSLIPGLLPAVRLSETIKSHGKGGIDLNFFLQESDAAINLSVVDRYLRKKKIDLRELWIERQRLLQFLLGQYLEPLTHHHLRIDQISSG